MWICINNLESYVIDKLITTITQKIVKEYIVS